MSFFSTGSWRTCWWLLRKDRRDRAVLLFAVGAKNSQKPSPWFCLVISQSVFFPSNPLPKFDQTMSAVSRIKSGQLKSKKKELKHKGDASGVKTGGSSTQPTSKRDSDCVRVFCRIRPLNKREQGTERVVSVEGHQNLIIKKKGEKPPPFTFDYVFDSDSTQPKVLNFDKINLHPSRPLVC